VLAVAVTLVICLHRRQGWSLAPLAAPPDRSPAGTDRSSTAPAAAPVGMRPSDR
jgi:hypothetical protein